MSAGNDQTDASAESQPIDPQTLTSDVAAEADSTTNDEATEGEDAQSRITALEAEVATLKDRWLRAVADLENYKKRTKREIDEAILRTTQKLLPEFLPVVDNLERALEVAQPMMQSATGDQAKSAEQVVTGMRMVMTEFLNALTKHGIEVVPAVGKPFDPSVHDALQQFDSPDHPPGVVIREFEKGYRLSGRLIRPARVIVAGAGSTGTAAADEQSDS